MIHIIPPNISVRSFPLRYLGNCATSTASTLRFAIASRYRCIYHITPYCDMAKDKLPDHIKLENKLLNNPYRILCAIINAGICRFGPIRITPASSFIRPPTIYKASKRRKHEH